MNDPDPAGPHPDVDALSDLAAGVLDDTPEAFALHDHLAGCPACAGVAVLLRHTRGLLASLPPVAMPDDVAARLAAALSAAAAEEAAAPATPVTDLAKHGRLTGRKSRSGSWGGERRWRPGVGAVAAGVALLFSAAVGIGALRSGGQRHPTGGAAAVAARSPGLAAARRLPPAGHDYTAATLAPAVRSLLGTPASAAHPAGVSPQPVPAPGAAQDGVAQAPDHALQRLLRPAGLGACVTALAGNARTAPLAVDFGRYQGRPVAVIVLPDRDPAKVQAWVVGPACGPRTPDLVRYQVVSRVG